MKQKITITFLLFLMTCTNHFLSAQEELDFEKSISALMKPYTENKDFDGYILIEKSDSIILSSGFGKNASHLTESSQFMVGSITKTFTAEAIAKLIDQQRISLTDSVNGLIINSTNIPKISLENLLNHSSGIKDYYAIGDFNNKRNESISLMEFSQWIDDYELDFEPGQRNSYSNSGYNLLALQVELASGLKYADFLEKYIFSPLDMNDSGSLESDKQKVTGLVQGYAPGNLPTLLREPNKINPSWLVGSGSVFASARDLLKWCSIIESRINKNVQWTPYGWGVRKRDSIEYIKQNGRIPGYSSRIEIYPSIGLKIVILNRIESDVVNSIANQIFDILFKKDVEIPKLRDVKKISLSQLKEYEGAYQFAPDFYVTFRESNGSLEVATGKGEDLDFSKVDYLGNDDFFFRITYNKISFNRDDNGKINGMNWSGSGPYPKVNE